LPSSSSYLKAGFNGPQIDGHCTESCVRVLEQATRHQATGEALSAGLAWLATVHRLLTLRVSAQPTRVSTLITCAVDDPKLACGWGQEICGKLSLDQLSALSPSTPSPSDGWIPACLSCAPFSVLPLRPPGQPKDQSPNKNERPSQAPALTTP
jgi:hypothetical protein